MKQIKFSGRMIQNQNSDSSKMSYNSPVAETNEIIYLFNPPSRSKIGKAKGSNRNEKFIRFRLLEQIFTFEGSTPTYHLWNPYH